jgi:hypothetical protein
VFTTLNEWLKSKTFNISNVSRLRGAPSGVAGAVKIAGNTLMSKSCSGGGTVATAFDKASHIGSGVKIYLDPDLVKNNYDYFLLTIVHKICYKVSIDIIDYHNINMSINQSYNAAWCEFWAQNSPDIALKNPENYALYFGEDNRRLGFLKPKCDGNILPVGFSYANGSPL